MRALKPGDPIWIQNPDTGSWEDGGVILERTRKRTYKMKLPSGHITSRNRKRIRYKHGSSMVVKHKEVERDEDDDFTRIRRSERIAKKKTTM